MILSVSSVKFVVIVRVRLRLSEIAARGQEQMNNNGPTRSLPRTAGWRFSRFRARWPAAAEFRRWAHTQSGNQSKLLK
jgi:hypothetical protein